jgi:hypothetical protein
MSSSTPRPTDREIWEYDDEEAMLVIPAPTER